MKICLCGNFTENENYVCDECKALEQEENNG